MHKKAATLSRSLLQNGIELSKTALTENLLRHSPSTRKDR